MPFEPPARILFLRPDTYGDLFLFEPVLRIVRHAWPQTVVGVLIRKPYEDAVPLFPAERVQWLTTICNPYRDSPGGNGAALDDLRAVVGAFAPDCVVAACAAQTWLEAAVATFLPEARQVSLGDGLTDFVLRAALETVLPVDWSNLYPEKIPVEPELPEWEKNLRLASALLGREAPRWWPMARVPEAAKAQAAQILAAAGLQAGEYTACAAAGIANVQIKSWPAEHYGETLGFLERERGIRALLIGHESERDQLGAAREAARRGGADPAIWTGRDGEMTVMAGLLDAARFYFGNDTGALHLAAALGRPVLPIFGGGHWPRFQPVARRSLTVVQPLPCFGCGWDCYFVDAPCVRTISPASVRRALEEFLRNDSESQAVFEAEGLEAGARALIHTATPQLRFLREDRAKRGKQIVELTAWLQDSEAKRAALDEQLTAKDSLAAGLQTDRSSHDESLSPLGPSAFLGPRTRAPRRFDGTGPDRRQEKNEMKLEEAWSEEPGAGVYEDPAPVSELRLRLQASRTQELVARAETRSLAKELALARRLLKYSIEHPPRTPPRAHPALVTGPSGKIRRLRAMLGTGQMVFHLDAVQHLGDTLEISGWAFRPAPEWDGSDTTVTLVFRHGTTIRLATTCRVARPDVAAHYTGRRAKLAGGACGLNDTGFDCTIPGDFLTRGLEWDIALRLECRGVVCEEPTGKQLWI